MDTNLLAITFCISHVATLFTATLPKHPWFDRVATRANWCMDAAHTLIIIVYIIQEQFSIIQTANSLVKKKNIPV